MMLVKDGVLQIRETTHPVSIDDYNNQTLAAKSDGAISSQKEYHINHACLDLRILANIMSNISLTHAEILDYVTCPLKTEYFFHFFQECEDLCC